ncbi:hypothetical protein DID76_03945 [Candidatus Marinamargulisbacteria bacterium SCGC AG-414-C22]|nr:hypothetical protein DID76_03945 [Candidatus Marinamargulisbacteria bacterium SCGC AG-414-C22]
MTTENFIDVCKKDLNDQQAEAVFFGDGPLLLIAGAGSGKTKTLVHRVARLIHDGVAPEQILLLTFTRKAAEEMLTRAANILDDRCANVSGGTFHAFAHLALRKYASYIGFDPEFTIMDRGDSEDLIQRIRKEKGLAQGDKRFPKKGTITSVIGKAINTNKSIEHVLGADYPQFLPFTEEIQQIAIAYEHQKRDMHVMDYDDLLVKLVELLTKNPDIQQKFRAFYRYILVDEYQDTNSIQANLIKSLINDQQNIMVVGDDSQSIYSFRGAHFENIMQFPTLFPAAKIIKLEQNYRSTQPILKLTNAVIERARNKFTKHLFSTNESNIKPKLIETDSDNEQSSFISKKILELREEGIPLSKIAILMRSGWHSNDLELELKSANIPFVKMGGFKFIETSHIKDVVCYFRVLYNPSDIISWNRLLLMFEGCGPGAAKKITDDIKQNKQDLSLVLPKHINKKYTKQLQTLLQFICTPNLKQAAPKDILSIIYKVYAEQFKLKYDDFQKRQSDLDSFEGICERFESLEKLLTEMSLDPPTESQVDTIPGDNEDEKLCLSTIHSAKGLEWHTVFLLSAVDGYLPSFQSLGDLGQLEEERRLMYVALTRAEQELFIMKPNLDLSKSNYYRFSGMQFSKLSRFLDDHNIIDDFAEKIVTTPTKKPASFFFPDDDDDDDPVAALTGKKSNKQKYYF